MKFSTPTFLALLVLVQPAMAKDDKNNGGSKSQKQQSNKNDKNNGNKNNNGKQSSALSNFLGGFKNIIEILKTGDADELAQSCTCIY